MSVYLARLKALASCPQWSGEHDWESWVTAHGTTERCSYCGAER